MERSQWYKVRGKRGINASTDIEGIRIKDAALYHGMVVPDEWFEDVADSWVDIFLNPLSGKRYIIDAYDPDDDEYPLLYSLYPGTMPAGVTFQALGAAEAMQGKWFRVVVTHVTDVLFTGAFNGIAALCDVPGICKAGDIAPVDAIVPVAWFSGLSADHMKRLLWSQYNPTPPPPSNRRRQAKQPDPITLRYIKKYKPSPQELEGLYEQFPGANPDYKSTKKQKLDKIQEAENANMDS